MRTRLFLPLLLSALMLLVLPAGCVGGAVERAADEDKLGNGWRVERSLELQYAQNFAVDYYPDGFTLISISDSSRFLLVPVGADVPEDINAGIAVLCQPVNKIYLVATSAMCLFDALDTLDRIRLSGTKAQDWYIDNARAAMEAGDILYAGRYSAPDYELLLSAGCDLAIESTMINHAPEVKKKLDDLGIPVLVEQSGYEPHPLGRTEWIKLYAVLAGQEDVAERLFDEQVAYMDSVIGGESTGRTVAFFYISSSGYAVARSSDDYVVKMIELAGGEYIFKELGDLDSAGAAVTLEMEAFYATAKEADYIIYNSAIGGGPTSLDEFVGMNGLLAEFKAVQNGKVWCTEKSLSQETTQLGLMISDIHKMLTTDDENLTKLNFLYKLQ